LNDAASLRDWGGDCQCSSSEKQRGTASVQPACAYAKSCLDASSLMLLTKLVAIFLGAVIIPVFPDGFGSCDRLVWFKE
jgi:hypothetical protein